MREPIKMTRGPRERTSRSRGPLSYKITGLCPSLFFIRFCRDAF